jgi:GR25 family glycosyltransferase involved in LPS biosynthesis
MLKTKGFYINLSSEIQRNNEIKNHIKDSNPGYEFERFEAIRGTFAEAKERSLTAGEMGIWKSWLKILEKEYLTQDKNYIFLHIIEDDARLGDLLAKAVNILKGKEIGYDIIFTDMYVNPSIYLSFQKEFEKIHKKGSLKIISNIYTGCLSSCLIHQSKISKLYKILNGYYSSNRQLKPLDNVLRNLMLKKELKIGVTAPFLTTVDIKYISDSTIQSKNHPVVTATQEYCTVLRQELSTFKNIKNKRRLLSKMKKLIDIKMEKFMIAMDEDYEHTTNEIAISKIIEKSEELCLFKYKYRENLIGDQDNQQNNM